MQTVELLNRLECFPVIAAIRTERWKQALAAPTEVLFYLDANLLTVRERIRQAHNAKKIVFVHLDLAEGIGKDKSGVQFLAQCGVDGIISTRAQIIRLGKEAGLLTVQRVFALDSQGMGSVHDILRSANPHFMEIMPGVIPKVVSQFSSGEIPVIAGGLIESRAEVTAALRSGALAVSTGCPALWEDA